MIVSDELLMAYADGQVSDADRALVERYLAADPKGQARLQVFIDTGPVMGRAADAVLSRPVPGWLVDTVVGAPRGCVAPARTAKGLGERLADGFASLFPVAAFASVALVAGAVVGWSLHGAWPEQSGRDAVAMQKGGALVAGGGLGGVLERVESGKAAALAGGLVATPVLSFKNRAGEACRQYAIAAGEAAAMGHQGIACRTGEGFWRLDMHAAGPVRRSSAGRTSPAAGEAGSLVDEAIDRIIAGDPLGREAEAALIRDRWVGTPPSPKSDGGDGGDGRAQ